MKKNHKVFLGWASIIILVMICCLMYLRSSHFTGVDSVNLEIDKLLEAGKKSLTGNQKGNVKNSMVLAKTAAKRSIDAKYYMGLGESYLLICEVYRRCDSIEKAKEYAHLSIQTFLNHKFLNKLPDSYIILGKLYPVDRNHIENRIQYFEKAQDYYILIGEKENQGHILKEIADLCQLNGDFLKAERDLHRALSIYKSVNYPNLQGVYDLLNEVNTGLGNYKEALYYGMLALEIAEKVNDTTLQLCTIYNRIGVVHYRLKEYAKAIEYYQKSLIIAERYDHIASIEFVIHNLTNALLKNGDYEKCLRLLNRISTKYHFGKPEINLINSYYLKTYNCLKDHAKARLYYQKVYQNRTELYPEYFDHDAFIELINYKIEEKNYLSARELILNAGAFYSKNKMREALSQVSLLKFRVDSSEGKWLDAIKAHQEYKALSDSIFINSRERQVDNLEIQFNSEMNLRDNLKEQSIQLLNAKSELKDAELKQAKSRFYFLFIGLIMVIGVLAIGFRAYRIQKRNSSLLEKNKKEIDYQNLALKDLIEQQGKLISEKEWLAKEVHHRVKNNLQIIVSLLDFQSKYLEDRVALAAIQNSQNRVWAISLIHQRLYQTEDMKHIDVNNYIKDIVHYLKEALSNNNGVTFEMQILPVKLDVSHVVPIGLIVNEVITNSLKYAFPNQTAGRIRLELTFDKEGYLNLVISDNGSGLPVDFNIGNSTSMGFYLIKMMSDQLEADFSFENNPGLCLKFRFREQK